MQKIHIHKSYSWKGRFCTAMWLLFRILLWHIDRLLNSSSSSRRQLLYLIFAWLADTVFAISKLELFCEHRKRMASFCFVNFVFLVNCLFYSESQSIADFSSLFSSSS